MTSRRWFKHVGVHIRPRTDNQLHAWLRLALDLTVARDAVLLGSDAPFDYLSHSFFERQSPRDCVVWANRGGGKTFLGAVATTLDLVFKPGIEIRILGGSLEQSARMQKHLRDLFSTPLLAPLVDGKITERRLRLTTGAVCQTLAQSHTSVRGCRVQKLRCDEVELFDPDVWEAAQLVTRSATCGDVFVPGVVEAFSTLRQPHGLMARLVDTTNNDTTNNTPPTRRLFRWGVVDSLEQCEPQRLCSRCPLESECAGQAKSASGFIPIDDAISLKARTGADAWQSEMLCQRPSRSDAVLPEFDPTTHVFDSDVNTHASSLFICGMDFGIRAPTVVLWAAIDADNVVRIVDERSKSNVILDEHIRAILDAPLPNPAWIGVDPAGRQRSDQTGVSPITAMRRAGLVIRDRRLGVMEGVNMIRRRLAPATGGPTLFVHQRCRTLIQSLEAYHYPPDRPESTEPVKDGADHAVDALRYLIVNLDRPHNTTRRRYI